MLHMCIPCDKIFHKVPYVVTLILKVWPTFENL